MSTASRVAKLAVVVLVGGAMAGCSMGGSDDSRIIDTQFDNANGMYAGNTVAVLGMKVGTIESIEPKGEYVDVKLKVDKSIKLPADVQAVTVSDSVLTDRHIELTPVYKDGPTLPDGAKLGLDHTKVPVEFDSTLKMAQDLSKSLGGDGKGNGPVADLLNTSYEITDHNGGNMKSALDELARALQMGGDHGAATKEAVTKVVDNLSVLTDAAASNDQTIRQFGSGVHQLSGILADQNLGTGDTGKLLNNILISTTDLLQKYRGQLHGVVTNGQVVSKTLADGTPDIGGFLDVLPMLTVNMYNSIDTQKGLIRAGISPDKLLLDTQITKDVCNVLKLHQLGCDTGKLQDFGPDFGLISMLTSMAELGKK